MSALPLILRDSYGGAADYRHWVEPMMLSWHCGKAFAIKLIRERVLPVLTDFPPEMFYLRAPEAIVTGIFGEKVSRRTWAQCLSKVLLDPDYSTVFVRNGEIHMVHSSRGEPKRFTIIKFRLAQVDGHWRFEAVAPFNESIVFAKAGDHWVVQRTVLD